MNTLTGTGGLMRLILRRDRILMPLWVVLLGVLPVAYVSSYRQLFPDAASRQHYADASAANSGFTALYGPLNGSSIGALVTWRGGFIPVVIGLVALLTVIRHTRTEEESGRRELVGSTVVGRHAGLAAALLTTLVASLVMGAILALAMVGQHLPAAGSVALGAQFATAGWVFAGVGAVAAQLTSGAGSARGLAIVGLGVAYVLRVVGDLSAQSGGPLGWLSWLSPIGWAHRIRPYSGERWWVLLLVVALTAALALAAVTLSARRDVGTGLLPARLGPAAGAPGLRSPLALAWRLHRGLLAAWLACFAVLGVVFGGVAKSIGDVVGDSQAMKDVFARLGGASALIDAYLATVMGLLGLIAAGYAIQATLRLRTEEANLRAEPVLASAVGRLSWAASHLVFSLLGPAAALAAAGLTTGLVHGLNTGEVGREVPRALGAAMVQLPAVFVLAGFAVALFGLVPRLSVAGAWGALTVCVLVSLIGGALQLSHWLLDVSPFTHTPKVPGGTLSATPLVILAVIAVALGVLGLAGLRRRDIPTA